MNDFETGHTASPLAPHGISVDVSLRRVQVDGVTLHMTPIEYRLLEHLVRSAGAIVARDELLAAARQRETLTADRALDVHVSHLRKKLDTRRDLIRTIRGAGYMFSSASGPA